MVIARALTIPPPEQINSSGERSTKVPFRAFAFDPPYKLYNIAMSENPEIARLRRELEQARRREEQATARVEQLERENQKTTLEEYLYNSHFHLHTKLRLADLSKSSTGYTKVEGKYYPKWLRPWDDFKNVLRQQHFGAIRRVYGERRLFHQESTTKDLGTTISRTSAGNEDAIDHFEKVAVENPVLEVLVPLDTERELLTAYGFTRLRFTSNIREFTQPIDVISQTAEEDLSEGRLERRRRTGPNKRIASEQRVKLPTTKPDGGGVRTHLGGNESLAFIYDYKAAHKISTRYLKQTVAEETLFMRVIQQINSDKSKTDDELQEQDRAEALITMALVQVFDYMIKYGVAYGYVAAGKSLLFLYVDRADLQTLYCHPCVPDEDVGEASAGDWADNMSCTAVAQLASFCLLSLQAEALKGPLLDAALQRAEVTLRKWTEPYEEAAQFLETENAESSVASSSQSTEGSEYVSSASPTGRVVPLRSRSSCKTAAVFHKDDKGDEDDEDGPGDRLSQPWTRSYSTKRKEGPSSGSSEDESTGMSGSAPTRKYCTQACLLGLKRGQRLDDNCPNVLSHRTAKGGASHHIDASEFTRLVSEQLRQDPYRGCWALDGWGKVGTIGVLFRLELVPYGYVFVGKGTLSGLLDCLEHEGEVYSRLESLQGYVVPVHLGLVHLDRGYVLSGGARVVHMMLMSWGGETLTAAGLEAADLAAARRRSSQAVLNNGVNHVDQYAANLLWNNERRRVMLIDFDHAVLLSPAKNKQLSKILSKKKRIRPSMDSGPENSPRKRSSFHNRLQ